MTSELEQRVGEVLHYLWDPIGVAGLPEARDEYDGYVKGVVRQLRAGASEEGIARSLDAITAEAMELMPQSNRSLEAAETLVR